MMIFSFVLIGCCCIGASDKDDFAIVKRIDQILQAKHRELELESRPIVDDLQFLRRVTLDLVGRIPTIEEIERFQEHPDRNQLVDRLVDSAEFDAFVSEAWTTWLIGYTNLFQTDRETFRVWLEDQLRREQSFKQIASRLITAEGSVAINGPANFLARHYAQPLTAVCRSFLGVRLECAQCHDHPFDRWTQKDYREMELFFRPLRRQAENGVVTIDDVYRPGFENKRPRFLTGAQPRTGRYRQELALYLTNCKPFARNFANRCWYFLMGRGIVDPPDDFNQENEPIDSELLETLADFARLSEFQVDEMFRAICKTDSYQREITHPEDHADTSRYFAARVVKPILPAQYVNSLFVGLKRKVKNSVRRDLLRRLTDSQDLNEDYQRLWDYRESVQQLMNNMTFQFRGQIGENNQFETNDLFLRLLTRNATQNELQACQGRSNADIMFALALSNEFYFNH